MLERRLEHKDRERKSGSMTGQNKVHKIYCILYPFRSESFTFLSDSLN